MSKTKTIITSISSIVILGVLVNAIIITTAYLYTPALSWILFITMPLLIVGIYNAKQTHYILDKHRIINLQEAEKQRKFELLSHSIYPNKIDETDLRVLIGNDQCSQHHNACVFNIGSINNHSRKSGIQSIKEKKLDYNKNLCGERLRTYSLSGKGLVWQIGSDYIGCQDENGNFNSKIFEQTAHQPEIKMIELVLSSIIIPDHSFDSTLINGNTGNIKIKDDLFPGVSYTAFIEAEWIIHFLDRLRELSGRKPIGIRLFINSKKEFHEICYAIRKTQLIPDFISVEGSFENANENHFGMPLYEALLFVSQTLKVYALEKDIKIIAYGKITSCFDILKVIALGANMVCSEMPGYSTIKYPGNDQKTPSVYKGQDINDFHKNLMKATVLAMKVCGFMNVSDITLSKFFRRLDLLHSKGFEELNGHFSYPGIVKKIYTSKTRPYGLQENRKKESIIM